MVMNIREITRMNRINQVFATIEKAKKEKKEINFKNFTFQIMERYGVTKRCAQEYIQVARFKL